MVNCFGFFREHYSQSILLLFSICLLLNVPTVDSFLSCTGAAWGAWGAWSTCPAGSTGVDPTITQIRSRTCDKMPTGCLIGSATCDGDMSQTLVCGTTTLKDTYSTIVFGTTLFDETTEEVTTTEMTTTTPTTTTTIPTTTTTVPTTTTTTPTTTTTASTVAATTTTVAGTTTTVAGTTTTVAGITTTIPGATTTVPGATTTVPGTTTTVPGATTTVPGTTTTTPGTTTTVPGATTTVPGATTTVPGATTTIPGATTTVPGATTTVPGTTTTVPGTTTTAGQTTTIPGQTTTVAASTTASVTDSTDAATSDAAKDGETTTVSFTFASDAPGEATTNIVNTESNTESYAEECGEPVTTLSTLSPGTMGTFFPGGGGGGGDGIEPMTFATVTPSTENGVTRSPTCRTTPVMTTTIPFKTCTMISVSSTVPMRSTTSMMESTTSETIISTTIDEKTTSSGSESTSAAAISTTGSQASTTEASVSSTESPVVSSSAPSVSDSPTTSAAEATTEGSSSESPNVSTEEPSVSSSAASVSDSPTTAAEETTQASEVSTDSQISTSEVPNTTLDPNTWKTCNDCPQINVQLFNGNPYEDASSVLNRYSASGCYYVQFFCRPIEIGDKSPVNTILSGDTTYMDAPLSASLACRDKKWVLLGSTASQAKSVTSLGCVYGSPTTTRPKTTTIPGIDLSNPCMNCTNLVVSQSNYPEGVTYLDHTLDKCLSVEAYCVPINGGKTVEMLYNLQRNYNGASSVNRTFECTKKSKWLDVATNTIINNITCIMPEATTTMPFVESTVQSMPSTDIGPQPTPEVSVNPATESPTSPDNAPPEADSTTASEQTQPGDVTTPAGQEVSETATPDETNVEPSTLDEVVTAEITTTAPSECTSCADVEPLAVTKSGTYNGMLVLWHYRDSTSHCRKVDVSCQGTVSSKENNTLILNPVNQTSSGIGEQVETLTCANGLWSGKNTKSATCLSTTAAVIPVSTTPRPTTPAPSSGCSSCRRIPVVILEPGSQFGNGLLKAVITYDSCMKLKLTCHGTLTGDNVALIYEDAPIATGTGEVSLDLTCNSGGTWITSEAQTIQSISCGYASQLLTTTPIPSACGVCNNMESAKALLLTNAYDGMIVLYNYADRTTNCKKVDISCQGTTATENATLYFNPIGLIATGPIVHELTLTCAADGTWKYGTSTIESVSCLVSTPTSVVIPATTLEPTTTTLNAQTPMCSQCARLQAEPVSTIDDSLQSGFTNMFFQSTGSSCSHVQVVCFGNTNERVTLLAATTSLVSGITSVSFNFTCNSGANWMTTAGTVVSSVACGRWNTTSTTTRPATTTPQTTQKAPTNPPITAQSKCGECSNLLARALQPASGSYDGMIVLNHYTNSAKCREVDVSCGPTINTENATIYFGNTVVATGAKQHDFTLSCNANSNWEYQGSAISTVSCLISNATSGVTVPPVIATTPRPVAGCGQCGRAPIVSVGSTSTYVNGFTTVVQGVDASQCSTINIKCQGTTTGDAVALLSSGMPIASGFGTCATNLTCNASSEWLDRNGKTITSLACGYKQAAVTQPVATTLAPTGLCGSCLDVKANAISQNYPGTYDGMVVMDHYIESSTNCRQAIVTCGPTTSSENATFYLNSNPITTGVSQHVVTLYCNSNAQWIYQETTISGVSCLISDSSGNPVPVTATTLAPVTNPAENLCSQCGTLPILSTATSTSFQQYSNGFTTLNSQTDSYGCRKVQMLCEGISSTEPVQIGVNAGISIESGVGSANWSNIVCNSQGKWTYDSVGSISSVYCMRTFVTTPPVEQKPSECGQCVNMRPQSMQSSTSYDGLLVITHQKDQVTNCRTATLTCSPTMSQSETSELFIDQNEISSNAYGQDFTVNCDGNGAWSYNNATVTRASCLVHNSSSTAAGKKRRRRQAGTQATACQSCGRFPMVSLRSFAPYMNGFVTLDMDDSGSCITVEAMCEGSLPDDDVAWIVSGTTINTGVSRKNMSFSCNSMSEWQYDGNIVFSQISCGKKPGGIITTTSVPTLAMNCPNLISAPLTTSELNGGESNGQLILDHYVDPTLNARVVVITCYGSSTTSNTTLSLDDGTLTISATGQVGITITCSASGKWIRNGIEIETAACIVTSGTGNVIPLTTTAPVATTTIPGSPASSNCARQIVSVIPDGYNSGYLSMNSQSNNGVLSVVMSCYAPAGINEAKVITSEGGTLTSGTTMVNMTIECNSNSQWVLTSTSGSGVAVGSIITTFSCVVPILTSTTAIATTVNPGCRACSNLGSIGLAPYQLDANERNGQFILDHFTDETHCRVVYLTCAGKASENSTILFDGGVQTISNQGMTSTMLTCTAQSTWDWYGSDITDVSCKVTGNLLLTTTPQPATTTALVVPGDDGLLCPRSSLIKPMISAGSDSGATLVLDTTIVNGVLSTKLTCSSTQDGGTAILQNGDGTVLGQATNTINVTLTCGANSQWVITSSTLASSPVGTVVNGLSCQMAALITTTTTIATTTPPTTPTTTTIPVTSDKCRKCPDMLPISLTSADLAANEDNGQLLLDHYVDPTTLCRIVVVKCRGTTINQNATIYFNNNQQTLSAQYGQVSTSFACDPTNQWLRAGVSITGIACKITSDVAAVSPQPITTQAPVVTTQAGTGPATACNRALTTAVGSGYNNGFMTLDTVTTGSTMTMSVKCSAPQASQTAVLLDSNNNQLSSAVSSTELSLTCNSNSQWVTSSGVQVTSLSCGVVPLPTTPAPTTPLAITQAAPTTAASGDCSQAIWGTWLEWSDCTDTCGSCGTHQRFRTCTKPNPSCNCDGSAYEKVNCNLAVCKYPRVSCCDGFKPMSSGGTFVCMA